MYLESNPCFIHWSGQHIGGTQQIYAVLVMENTSAQHAITTKGWLQ